MDLAQAVEQLYAGDPDEFVATRKTLAVAARAAKDRDLTKQIEGLRRPTRSAWLVNLLARADGSELADLLDLAPALAEAHTTGGAALRQLMTLRRQAVDGLVQRALDLGAAQGYAPTEAVRAEVQTILDAALTQPEVGQLVRAGTLVAAPESAAAFPTDLFAALAPVIPLRPEPRPTIESEPKPEPEPEVEPEPEAAPADPALRRAAERALTRAELDLEDARDALAALETAGEHTETALVEATRQRDDLAAALADLTTRLSAAEDAVAAADAEHAAHVERTQAAAGAVADAEAAVATARERLGELDRPDR